MSKQKDNTMRYFKKGAVEGVLKVLIALIIAGIFIVIAFLAVKHVLSITLK